ncbi:MAG: PDZ domain-containing protein [Acidobacteria bacterium]|nr:PDZ domain-containing protein [Acidobacteriota bacterium]
MLRKEKPTIPLIARLIAPGLLVCFVFTQASPAQIEPDRGEREARRSLVRVRIMLETSAPDEAIMINGRRLEGYRPRIVQVFPATGVVMDDEGHVMTFLGYRWVDIHSRDPQIEIIAGPGQALPGKMIGIDESMGVAVVRSQRGRLRRTPLCTDCRIRDGATVAVPVFDLPGGMQFETVRVLSLSHGEGSGGRTQWTMRVDRLPGAGEPILDSGNRVLGFVASQRPSADDPEGLRMAVYPMSQLLTSAERILRTGGDIRTGWLGVYLADASPQSEQPVLIRRVEKGSPAQRAGLAPEDRLLKWNGKAIAGVRRFIQLVQDTAIGSRVALDILRHGKPMTVYPVIEARTSRADVGRFVFSFPDTITLQDSGVVPETGPLPRSWVGMTSVPLSPELAEGLQIQDQRGLLILNVVPGTPFSRAGVMAGDIILAAGEASVGDLGDLYRQLRAPARDGHVALKLLRKGSERNIAVRVPVPAATEPRR